MTAPYDAEWVREFVDRITGPHEMRDGWRMWRDGQSALEFITALWPPSGRNVELLKDELAKRSKWEIANVLHGLAARVEEIVILRANTFSAKAREEDAMDRVFRGLP